MSVAPTDRRDCWRTAALAAAALAVYLAAAVVLTWPLAQHLDDALPQGCEAVSTVPLLNLWTVWWNADRAAHGWRGYWDAPIFYPTRRTFVFSEAQPTTLVVAPVVWATDNVVLAYNLYVLAALALNGWCAAYWLRRAGHGWWLAGVGGVLVETLPFVLWQFGVLQLVVFWPVVWTTGELWEFVRRPEWLRAGRLGVAFGVTYAACNYYGLFLALLLIAASPCLIQRTWLTTRFWLAGLIAAAIAVACVWPIVHVQRAVASEHQWRREMDWIVQLSAHARDYTNAPWPQWLESWELTTPGRSHEWSLGSGWLKLLTAAAGAIAGVFGPRRRWTAFLAVLGLCAFCCSLGPNFELWNLNPYKLLWRYAPGFGQIRSPFRFAVFVQWALVGLSLEGLDLLRPGRWPRWQAALLSEARPRWRRWGLWGISWCPLALASGALAAETHPDAQALAFQPARSPLPAWVEFLRDETPAGAPIVCLPLERGSAVNDFEEIAQWMYWGMFHRRPLLNGYSGYFPQSYLTLKGELLQFPAQGAPRLSEMGARYAVVRRNVWSQQTLAQHPQTAGWSWRFSDDQLGVDVYELPPPAAQPST